MLKRLGIDGKGIMKVLKYAGLLFLLYILQAAVFTHIRLFGVKPLILPVAIMCAALFEGMTAGGIVGLAAGILCDMSFNQPALQFTIFMTALGFAAGYLFETVLSTSFTSFLICTTAALFVCAVIQFFGIVVYNGADILSVLKTAVIQTVYSAVFIVPLYYVVRRISGTTGA